ncbi:elongation factor P [Rickettsiales endosymbiont of Stachyamoeba lipophora]|uniref:elongation factor P n=1 Tax=Rickettsiales endosymbiont of Stachyamoeba lipophora TaxID=2486578 RepID=UPI000F64EA92|nr:elongation factor P [Rickettsiales endosymbiont of Stachyamoeba lipophora]AZL16178.1 elongation factor P [Rickettsiales endosymbiont of Stachyamoeba lipophora]
MELASSIKAGNVLLINGKLYVVTKNPDHTQPGKGGAYVQVEMKEIKTGTKIRERWSVSDKVERVRLEQMQMQYLYKEDDKLVIMNPETFDQFNMDSTLLGEQLAFLEDGMMLTIEMHENDPITALVPATLICEIAECEPVIKGQTAASSYKPALLTNGLRIMVPPFIEIGNKVVVRTEDVSYVERAK